MLNEFRKNVMGRLLRLRNIIARTFSILTPLRHPQTITNYVFVFCRIAVSALERNADSAINLSFLKEYINEVL